MPKNAVYLLAMMAILLVLPACTTVKMLEHAGMKPPELQYRTYEIRDVTTEQVSIDLVFEAQNPNDYDIDGFFVDYRFLIQDQSIAQAKGVKVKRIPQGLSVLVIPVEVTYQQLFDAAGMLTDLILSQRREVASQVHVKIYGEYLLSEMFGKRLTREYSYEHDLATNIPLPEINAEVVANKVKDAINGFLGFKVFEKEAPAPQPLPPPVEKSVPLEAELDSGF